MDDDCAMWKCRLSLSAFSAFNSCHLLSAFVFLIFFLSFSFSEIKKKERKKTDISVKNMRPVDVLIYLVGSILQSFCNGQGG